MNHVILNKSCVTFEGLMWANFALYNFESIKNF